MIKEWQWQCGHVNSMLARSSSEGGMGEGGKIKATLSMGMYYASNHQNTSFIFFIALTFNLSLLGLVFADMISRLA